MRRDHEALQSLRHRARGQTSRRPTAGPTPAIRYRPSAGLSPRMRQVTAEMAAQVAEIFTEVIIAPGYDQAALEILTAKKNQRLLRCPPGRRLSPASTGSPARDRVAADRRWAADAGRRTDCRSRVTGLTGGGWLPGPLLTPDLLADLEFAWRACRSVKSNAILLASSRASVGIGMGQVNRVDSARLAVTRAGHRAAGSVGGQRRVLPVC